MVYAVMGLIKKKDEELYLGVSRKYNKDDFGLPGGKINRGETEKEALKREIKEETGLDVTIGFWIYERKIDNSKGIARTYEIVDYSGEIHTEEEGVVKWVDKEKLCSGSFGQYNTRMFSRIEEDIT